MVERVVIEDGISDGTVIEAVAISAEFLPQTSLLGPISNLLAGIMSLKQTLMMPAAQSPASGPPSTLPAGRSPMRWQSFELLSRFSDERIDLRRTLLPLHGLST